MTVCRRSASAGKAGWITIIQNRVGPEPAGDPANDAYTDEQIVADIAGLHDYLGGGPAIRVGHDWGSVIVGSLVSHEPRRSRGAVLISVPYLPSSNVLSTLVPLVDRAIYPADEYPDGQWDHYRYYTTHFRSAVADLYAGKASSLASIFRRGDPAAIGKPMPNATVTRKGGRFGAARLAPPTQPDAALWPAADFDRCARRAGDLTVANLAGAHWLPVERKPELVGAMRNCLHRRKL